MTRDRSVGDRFDKPNDITVTNDFATVEATHDSEELKSAMQIAGVVVVSTIWRPFLSRLCSFGKGTAAAVDRRDHRLVRGAAGQNIGE